MDTNWFGTDETVSTTATAELAGVQAQSSSGSFFDILDSFSGAATRVATTVATLQGQATALELARARNEAEARRTLAALEIGTINAQRDVAIAKANAMSLSGGGSLLPLIIVGALIWMAVKA